MEEINSKEQKSVEDNFNEQEEQFTEVDQLQDLPTDSEQQQFINYREKYTQLLEKYRNLEQEQSKNLQNLIKDKQQIQAKFQSVLSKVAKWQNDKNILLRNLELDFEKKATDLVKQILDILDMLDDLHKLDTIEQRTKQMITHQVNVLKNKFELKEIEITAFDPSLHVALNKQQKGETIISCVKKGYYYKDKIIRYASVLLD